MTTGTVGSGYENGHGQATYHWLLVGPYHYHATSSQVAMLDGAVRDGLLQEDLSLLHVRRFRAKTQSPLPDWYYRALRRQLSPERGFKVDFRLEKGFGVLRIVVGSNNRADDFIHAVLGCSQQAGVTVKRDMSITAADGVVVFFLVGIPEATTDVARQVGERLFIWVDFGM